MSDVPDNPEPVRNTEPGPGPKTPEGKARALANLTPPFPPGVSGNPAGRKTAGASIREWLNSLAEQELTEDEVRAIARDKRAPGRSDPRPNASCGPSKRGTWPTWSPCSTAA